MTNALSKFMEEINAPKRKEVIIQTINYSEIDHKNLLLEEDQFLYELGQLWGEKIWDKLLNFYSYNNIESMFLKPGEISEYQMLYNIYQKVSKNSEEKGSKEWKKLVDYMRDMKIKYYPPTCQFEMFLYKDFFDKDKLSIIMKSIESFLWNTDCSCYGMDNITQVTKTQFSKGRDGKREGKYYTHYVLQFNFKLD